MYTIVRRFFWWLTLMLALLLAWSPLRAFAAERTFIPASAKGPMADLKNAGKSIDLLTSLEHRNGNKLKPSETRSLRSKGLYLPVNAVPDKAGRIAFVKRELALLGSTKDKVAHAAKQQSENKLLVEAKAKADNLNTKLVAADLSVKDLESKLEAASARIRELEEYFPWHWLLILAVGWGIIAAAIWLVFKRRSHREADKILLRHGQKVPADDIEVNNLKNQIIGLFGQIKQLTNERNQAHQEVDRLTEKASILQADKDLLKRNWNDIIELRARLNELEKEKRRASGTSASG